MPEHISRLAVEKAEKSGDAVMRVHLITGHGGGDVCYHSTRNNFDEVVPKTKIMEVIGKCETCAYHNAGSRLRLGLVPMSGIFERVGVDCIGFLPRSGSGMRHIILATDYASGYVEGVAVKNKTAGIVSDFLLKNVLMRHGPPRIFQMDSGKEFLNSTVKDLGRNSTQR